MDSTSDATVASYAKKLSAQRGDFEDQLSDVAGRFPLVMLAYRAQQAMILELAHPRSIQETQAGPILGALGISEYVEPTKHEVEYRERLRKFQRCQGTAETAADILACIDAFVVR